MTTFPGANASIVGGHRTAPTVLPFVFWTPIGGTNAAKAIITLGAVCVPDVRQRGAYTNAAGATRAAVGGAPDYAGSIGGTSDTYNVTIVNDQGTPAPATRCQFVAVLKDASLASGVEGNFTVRGPCKAQVTTAVNKGDRLDLDVTNNTNAGGFKVAAANGTVYAIARQTLGAAGICDVELVNPHQATTAGNL